MTSHLVATLFAATALTPTSAVAQAALTGSGGLGSRAAPAGWDVTFAGSQVASSLAIDGAKVIIAAPGKDDESEAAARALRASVKSKVAFILSGDSVPGVFDDDQAWMEAAKKLPVTHFVSVRVFRNDDGFLAVVTSYDLDGKSEAISGSKGISIATSTSVLGEQTTGDAISSVVSTHRESLKERIAAYEERVLWVGSQIGVSSSQYSTTAYTYDVVYLGKYKKQLTSNEIYDLFADPAIDARVESQIAQNWGWIAAEIGGGAFLSVVGAAGVAGLFAAFAVALNGAGPVPSGAEFLAVAGGVTVSVFGGVALILGGLLVLAGLMSAAIIGFGDEPGVLEPEEIREHVDKYNTALRKELGLDDVEGLPTGYRHGFIRATPRLTP